MLTGSVQCHYSLYCAGAAPGSGYPHACWAKALWGGTIFSGTSYYDRSFDSGNFYEQTSDRTHAFSVRSKVS